MATNDVTKYLKFANVQMAAESLFGFRNPSAIPVGAVVGNDGLTQDSLAFGNNNRASKFTSNTKGPTPRVQHQGSNTRGQSQIVLRGAHMNEKSDSMEKKSTPTPGAHDVEAA